MNKIELLQSLGVRGHPHGDEWDTVCPIHGSSKGKNAINFSINVQKNVFKCHSGRCGISGRLEELIKLLGGSTGILVDDRPIEQLMSDETEDEEEYVPNDVSELDSWKFVHPSLLKRGFDRDFLIANKVGYDKNSYRSTIPIFGINEDKPRKDQYWGAIKRAVVDFQSKYENPKNLPKKKLIYVPLHYELNEKSLLVVAEGQLNALMATQWGDVGVATLGSQPSQEQVNQIVELSRRLDIPILLWYDNDKAGVEATKKFLEYHCDVFVISWQTEENDICDLSYEKYARMKEEVITGLEYLLNA